MDWEKVKGIVEEIKKKTAMTAYSLHIDPDKKPDIYSSKFGGVPYWDFEKEYPRDQEGNLLMLLAQINFDQADVEEPLPKQGMLQFFIGSDELYGMDFDEPDKQDTFRVVYHETINYSMTEEQVRAMGIPVSNDAEDEECTPVFREASINIEKQTVYMGMETYQFNDLFRSLVKDAYGLAVEDIDDLYLYSEVDEDVFDKMWEELSNMGHWLLGYPSFTQTDPREYEEKYRIYDTLLFQMDSDNIDKKDYVLWGDCGVANFFINGEDLKKRDFSKVLYNWDCC